MSQAAGANPAPGYAERPEHRVELERRGGRVTVRFAGAVVADSRDAVTVLETGHSSVHYLPRSDVRTDLLQRTARSTYCPFKGAASYWTLTVDGRVAENAVWSYETPYDECRELRDRMAFYASRVDGIDES